MGNKLNNRIKLNNIYGSNPANIQNTPSFINHTLNIKWKDIEQDLLDTSKNFINKKNYIDLNKNPKFLNTVLHQFLLKYKNAFMYSYNIIYDSILAKFQNINLININDVANFLSHIYTHGKMLKYNYATFAYLR